MPIIEVNHVTKEYQLGQLQSLKNTALNQWLQLTGQPIKERAPFKALDDVTFSVEQGAVLFGIIGTNRSVESTMLNLLANTLNRRQSLSRVRRTSQQVADWPAPNAMSLLILRNTLRRSSMNYRDRITIEPGKRGGKPCIRGMRMTVYDVLDSLASGMTPGEILADFPYLTAEDIQACLAYASDRERHQITVAA